MKRIPPLAVLLLIYHCTTFCQHFQNLGFEVVDDENPLPKEWYIVEEDACQFKVDLPAFSGKTSFLLVPVNGDPPCSATIINELEKSLYKNKKKIKLIARAKKKGGNSQLSLIVKQLSEGGQEIVKPSLSNREFLTPENEEWKTLEQEWEIDSATKHLAFGIKTSLSDSLWIDAFEIHVDGSKITDSEPPKNTVPSADELRWIDQNCLTIDSVNQDKLNVLADDMVGKEIIALGEVTHGSSQIYKLKSLLVKFLVENEKFSVLAMEMDMAEAEMLNKYVLDGKGDPRALLNQTRIWPWKTEEFLELLKWIHQFNRVHGEKVQITGFDLPISSLALDSILSFAYKHDQTLFKRTSLLKELFDRRYYDSPEKVDVFLNEIEEISQYMNLEKDDLIKLSDSSKFSLFKYKIESLKQSATFFKLGFAGQNFDYRDQCMAENISWQIKKNPTSRIVIWAHNAHISKGDYGIVMGKKLNEKHPFFSIGFALGEGSFNASDQWGYRITPYPLNPPINESFELFFMKSGKEICFLNLLKLKENPQNEWLFERRKLRYIGATSFSRYQFTRTSLIENFDALIFIRRSTPSHLIFQR